MPYAYQAGDYYRGDYYRGDGILAGIGGAIKGAVTGLVKGGPIGAIAGAIKGGTTGLLGSGKSSLPPPPINMGTGIGSPIPSLGSGLVAFKPPPVPVGGDRQWDIGSMLPGGRPLTYTQGGLCPAGYRLNKSGHWRKNGTYVPPASVCVKCRKMNVTNPRALRKGIRRAQGFAKLAKRVMSFVQARAPKGRALFRKKRR